MRMIFAGFAALALTSAAQAQDDADTTVLAELGEPYVSASVENGARIFRRCQSCHTVDEGGRNMVGPNLHGVFGADAGAKEGFRYSPAMSESGIVWSAETLDAYLANPRTYIPRNRMSFAGLRDEEDRNDLIAWLAVNTN
ncbi:cytochrome c family protein [Oceanicaulis alexandrii]|uniref:c-type cytochrome n=1 Tax=Oceanicaulis TaxID=153232 RepID=UPI0035D073A4